MLLSYCFTSSHPLTSKLETQSSPVRGPDTHDPFFSDSSSPSSTEPEHPVHSRLPGWSPSLSISLQSSVPVSLSSLFGSEPSDKSQELASSTRSDPSKASPSGVASWFSPPFSKSSTSSEAPAHLEISPNQSSNSQQVPEASDSTGGTTFTFVLFGAASTAAVYLLVRQRRAMNRLQTAKSLAYRDARAWRRVALDFARINALAAGRVQNLVATSLQDGQAGGEIGRQIEREIEEASRLVAQRRNWIQEQDRKDAEANTASTKSRTFADVWEDHFDPGRAGFFFESRSGRRSSEMGGHIPWQKHQASHHNHVPPATTDAAAYKASEAEARCSSSAADDLATSPTQAKRSAQLKWQRVAGHSATPAPFATLTASETKAPSKSSAPVAGVEQQAELREEWIGDVDRAIRERDLKSSQASGSVDRAAADVYSGSDSEEHVEAITDFASHDTGARETASQKGENLLPVSDLHIATDGRLREDSEQKVKCSKSGPKTQKTEIGPTRVNTIVSSSHKYSYPISDRFRDLDDIFITAWDDNFAGLSSSSTNVLTSKPNTGTSDSAAKPHSAFFEKLREKRTSVDTEPKHTSADDTEFMAQLMFPDSAAKETASSVKASPAHTEEIAASSAKEDELPDQLERKDAELVGHKNKIAELSERLDLLREMCHNLTDEAQRREKTHKIQIEQLDQKVGLFTIWAEEMQRRLGLETPPFFASLRKPLKRD